MKANSPLIIGNWKLNPAKVAEAEALAGAVARRFKQAGTARIALAPSFPHLPAVGKKLMKSAVALAAQDVSHQPLGPFTGEVSVSQLKDLGVSYVIIGHSERRALGESNELVRQKLALVLKHRLTPIVCVGERARDEAGQFYSFVEEQLRSLTEGLSATALSKVVLAYEPIWAIGTGANAAPEDVKEMQLFIESTLAKRYDRATARKVTLLYGGSVKPRNAAELHAAGGVGGFLVGGASLRADDFIAIIDSISS